MKLHKLLTTSLVAVALAGSTFGAWSADQRVFGFSGEVNSFDRSNGAILVDDSLFRTNESTLVYKTSGSKGTLSDIRSGVKVGFYPGTSGQMVGASVIEQIWILPRNWSATPGYAESPDN